MSFFVIFIKTKVYKNFNKYFQKILIFSLQCVILNMPNKLNNLYGKKGIFFYFAFFCACSKWISVKT